MEDTAAHVSGVIKEMKQRQEERKISPLKSEIILLDILYNILEKYATIRMRLYVKIIVTNQNLQLDFTLLHLDMVLIIGRQKRRKCSSCYGNNS